MMQKQHVEALLSQVSLAMPASITPPKASAGWVGQPGAFRLDGWWAAFRRRFLIREFYSFLLIGLVCTLLYLIAYRVSRASLPALAANGLALACTAGPNFIAIRTFTFRAQKGPVLRQAGQYSVCYALGVGASSLALATFLMVWADPPREIEFLAALLSTGFATVIRYEAARNWIFPPRDLAVIP